MAEFGMGTEYGAFGVPLPPAAPAVLPAYDLRPLSTGEILDRTFALYRQRFWLYAGLSAIASVMTTLGTAARLTWGLGSARMGTGAEPVALMISGGVTVVTTLLYLLAYCPTQAATVSAVSAVYLGEPTSIGTALRTVRRHWYRYILIGLWMGWSAVWLPFTLMVPGFALMAVASLRWLGVLFMVFAFLSFIYAPFAYIRNSLGIVASVSETLGVRASMRRSKVLVAGHKGRVFVLMLLVWVLSMVAGVPQSILAILFVGSHGVWRIVLEAMTLLATFVTGSVVGPVGAIALCLFYIDERVRKEGFDVETLMNRAFAKPVIAVVPDAAAASVEPAYELPVETPGIE